MENEEQPQKEEEEEEQNIEQSQEKGSRATRILSSRISTWWRKSAN